MTDDYRRGAYAAWTYLLNYLNTLENNTVDKRDIYKAVYNFKVENIR